MSVKPPRPLTFIHEVDREVRIVAHAAEATASVELMRYVYAPTEAQFESPRPYVHPLRTPGGRLVTVFRPWDHVWHKGITMALPNVGPDNFWGGATYTRKVGWYADLKNNGSQDHDTVIAMATEDDRAVFRHALTWRRQPADGSDRGDIVFTEMRTLTATLAPGHDAWVLGWRSELTNVSGAPIEMGSPTTEGRENAGYGGLFWRGPRSFTGGELLAANGVTGEDVRGTRGEWAGFCGRHDGADGSSTVVFVDQSAPQGFDTKWFVRSEPFACMNPAPFFDRVRVVEVAETIVLEHAVAIADGAADATRMTDLAAAAANAATRASAVAGLDGFDGLGGVDGVDGVEGMRDAADSAARGDGVVERAGVR
ncbi:hypothetical protein GCM10028798_10730 [Humibacter antri]